ncbi:hypothetical protein [sulfur-oxidizing endosymbiont of Gigantopelta aegis]|nr:hypothetical protein [sulfur-oxidizing endosymbiont of Gigantopelta aegis]
MKIIQNSLMAAAVGCSFFVASQAQAVNWLMVQGTEVQGSAPRAKVQADK